MNLLKGVKSLTTNKTLHPFLYFGEDKRMKKFMIGLLFIILLSTTLSANAETVVLKANSYDKIRDAYFDYHNIHVLSNQEGNFFW